MNSLSYIANVGRRFGPIAEEAETGEAPAAESRQKEPPVDAVATWPVPLLLRPLLWVWAVLAYPYRVLFAVAASPSVPELSPPVPVERSRSPSPAGTPAPQDLLRSPSSSPRYSLPPPRTLLPVNIKPKLLVLDLDETLIHSVLRTLRALLAGTGTFQTTTVEVRLPNLPAPTLYHVFKRPFCDQFLRTVSAWYELVVFTASVQEYADPVIDWLEMEGIQFSRRYYRQHCTYREGVGYIKDMSVVCAGGTELGRDLLAVVIVDNLPVSFAMHTSNALQVEGWVNDPNDLELMQLVPVLRGIRATTDVRAVLGLRNGVAAFE